MTGCYSKYYDERKNKIEIIVLHSVAFEAKKAIEIWQEYEVSSHYIIDINGEVIQVIKEENAARHAGVASWREYKEKINSCSIGIELCNFDLGQSKFSQEQQKSLIKLLKPIIKKYNIKPWNIVGHSDIAPQRKPDPGKCFDWQELAKNGIGLWYDIKDCDKLAENNHKKLLEIIGYNTTDINAALYAFCRHFYPKKVKTDKVEILVDKAVNTDEDLTKDEELLKVLKAVAYRYDKESKAPCKI